MVGSALAIEHKPITNQLIQLLHNDPKLKKMLTESIDKARQVNPDKSTNPVQSLQEYYNYLDKYVGMLPGQDLATASTYTRDDMLNGACYFYFLVDQPLDSLKNKNLYKNTLQYYPKFSKWLVQYAKKWGEFLDTPRSWNNQIYQKLYNSGEFNLQKGWYGKDNHWKTFNEWFARKLSDPKKTHPISQPRNDRVVISPADSVPRGVWPIDNQSRIKVKGGLTIKMARYYYVGDLLKPDSQYKKVFANGWLTHTFLNANDYHRYHYAVTGEVVETAKVTKNVALNTFWSTKEKKCIFSDTIGWQFSQTRGYVIVKTKKYGYVALIPMGMAQVSSVNFIKPILGYHKKGDTLGFFQFGGSDFVMLFQHKSHFKITAPKHSNGKYKHILMGQEYGRFSH